MNRPVASAGRMLVLLVLLIAIAPPALAHHKDDHQRPKDTPPTTSSTTTTTNTTTTSTTTTTTMTTTATTTTTSTTTTTMAPLLPAEEEPISQFGYGLDFGPQDIVCGGVNQVQLLYGHHGDNPNRYGEANVMSEIRDAAYDASGIMNSEAEIHSNDRYGSRVQYACTSGTPTILNAGKFPDSGYPDTGPFRQHLCDLGFSNPARVYLVLLDGYTGTNYASSTCNGARYSIVSLTRSTERIDIGIGTSLPNPLNNGKLYLSRDTFLHEMLHNFGAVPRDAPNRYTYRGGHCKEGRDIMCYGPENDTSFCPERTWVDCNGQDYFNPTPVPGTWLYENPALNVGHCVEPFTSCAYTGRGKEPTDRREEVPLFQPVWDIAEPVIEDGVDAAFSLFEHFPTDTWNELWDAVYWETLYPTLSGTGS